MSIASAVLLAIYFLIALYAGISPSNDPQRGMAQGFIIFAAVVLLAILVVVPMCAVTALRMIGKTKRERRPLQNFR